MYHQTAHLVYSWLFSFHLSVRPVIKMTGLRKNLTYTEGEDVIGSCEIERIFPKPVTFTIRFGGSNRTATVKENTDGSYKVIGNITKTLNMADHNKNITCEVTPKIGIVTKVTQSLKVQCEYIRGSKSNKEKSVWGPSINKKLGQSARKQSNHLKLGQIDKMILPPFANGCTLLQLQASEF